jgi:lipoprotein-anchoring transpeptidase ErfK/SrfK
MLFSRFILAATILASCAAVAEAREYRASSQYPGYRGNGGYAEDILVDERHREPVYELRSEPRYYAPRRNRSAQPLFAPDRPTYAPGGGRMYRDPYDRGVQPRNARLQVPANPAPRRSIPAQFKRQTVPYNGPETPGSIVIDTKTRHLYLVQNDGTALRYGVGVGRDGFQWTGQHKVTEKKEWPAWRPPAEMRQRRPDLPEYMEGGPDNPLGARALYLGSTLYRIHGSNEPWTIGQAVSSGCFRMTNDDVQDLYERVPVGATVKVL